MVRSRAFVASLLLTACGEVQVATDGSPGGGGAADAAEESPDAGEPDAAEPDAAEPDAPPADRVVFVTSHGFTGAMGGLAGADQRCQSTADEGGLPGVFMAWLSDSTGSPATRMSQRGGPFRLTDGTAIAADWADLTDGSLAAPVDRDELGNLSMGTFVCQGGEVWTNTTASGVTRASDACSDWSTAAGTSSSGNVGFADAKWTESECGSITCRSALPIYCVQQ
jgi:hypothetical protein